jgi:hypothetical protein
MFCICNQSTNPSAAVDHSLCGEFTAWERASDADWIAFEQGVNMTTIRFDVKWTAEAYNQWGEISWGLVSKVFQSSSQLQGVTLGNDLGDKRQITNPLWPKNTKIWSVDKRNIMETVIDEPLPDGDDPALFTAAPGEIQMTLTLKDSAGVKRTFHVQNLNEGEFGEVPG